MIRSRLLSHLDLSHHSAFRRAHCDRSIRVGLLTGESRTFSIVNDCLSFTILTSLPTFEIFISELEGGGGIFEF